MSGNSASAGPDLVVAAFDFDGTLTTSDSFLRFLAWRRPAASLAADLFLTSPLLFLYAIRLVGNESHKMALFHRQFAGMTEESFKKQAHEFSLTEVPAIVRPEALRRLKYHQRLKHQVVIVTASLVDWISPWAESHGVTEVLGSCAEVREGRMTGRLSGPNCHGPEKLRRLLELYPDRSSYSLFAYGDSQGDKDLLAVADEAYYRYFP
jgi:phosphatidylglycerophosphatase C